MLPTWTTPDGVKITNDPVAYTKTTSFNAGNGVTTEGFTWQRIYDGKEKIYFKVDGDHGADMDWDVDGSVQVVYFFKEVNNVKTEAAAVAVKTTADKIYSVDVPAGEWTHMIIVRCNKSLLDYSNPLVNMWEKKDDGKRDICWGQTGDIAIRNGTEDTNHRADISMNYYFGFVKGESDGEWGVYPRDLEFPENPS